MLFPFPNRPLQPRRVAVTGAGVITALGSGWAQNAAGFRAGRSAFREVSHFDVSRQRCKIAGELDLPAELPPHRLSKRSLRRLSRGSRMLLHATLEAAAQAGWEPHGFLPVVLGSTGCGAELGESFYRHALNDSRARGQAVRSTAYQGQRQALDLLEALGSTGPMTLISNACASGSNAIGHAFEMIRSGRADRAITGGYDALGELVFGGFDSLQALSLTPCRPFDASRSGLTLGEGAAILTLESLESAASRGAAILGEIIGYGASTDIHHLTQPHPNGDAAFRTMHDACQQAGIAPSEVSYVNAHGTGTLLNDASEAAALQRWRGSCITSLRVSSTKASVGHLLGAAGAVEAVVCLMALRGQWLPPQTGIENVDPACQFQLVRAAADSPVEIALSNSFGFGGANASLLFRRWP